MASHDALIIRAQAPANIALVKYMGKRDASCNLPWNDSLSMTLNRLKTWMELTPGPESGGSSWQWVREAPLSLTPEQKRLARWIPPAPEGEEKITRHLSRVQEWVAEFFPLYGLPLARKGGGQPTSWILRSANTFPPSAGIASSASAFAALTLAAVAALCEKPELFGADEHLLLPQELRQALWRLARRGSGSAIRSFAGPWVVWSGADAHGFASDRCPPLAHFVVLVSQEPKSVSSSSAHLRVKTSPLWEGRQARACSRVQAARVALEQGQLQSLARLAWAEAWEMHSLFHTAQEDFSYFEPGTLAVLQWLRPWVQGTSSSSSEGGDARVGDASSTGEHQGKPQPVIVTLDAGANVHITVLAQEKERWQERLRSQFPQFLVLEDEAGRGASLALL